MTETPPARGPQKGREISRIIEAGELIRSQYEVPEDEKAFMARHLVQVTLPHSDPGKDTPVWFRTNGNLRLTIESKWDIDTKTNTPRLVGIPYGSIPRLLLFWITTEALKKESRRLELGESLSSFMKQLELAPTGGRHGSITRLRQQMNRLFRARISFDVTEELDTHTRNRWLDMAVAPKGELWWDHRAPDQATLWGSWIELSEDFFQAITSAPVPLDMRALHALKRSPLALDFYAWTAYKTFLVSRKGKSQFVPWAGLVTQFGADYTDRKDFKRRAKAALRKVSAVYPGLKMEEADGGLIIHPGRPAVTHRPSKR